MPNEILEQQSTDESLSIEQGGLGVPWISVGLMVIVAVVLWIGSLLLPDKALLLKPDTAENWINFLERCLRDILQTLGIVVAAIGVAAFFPGLGRWRWGLVGGFFLGLAFNARPLTAMGLAGGIGIATLFALPWPRLNTLTTRWCS